MGPRGLKRRDELLQAALELFAAGGYEGTSTRSIAEHTGVTEAVLFKHFPTKRELFLEVLRQFGPEQIIKLPVDELADRPLAEALKTQVTAFLDAQWEHRKQFFLLFQSARKECEAREELHRQYASVRESVRRLLEIRAARGEVRPEMTDAALQTIGMAMRGFHMRSWHQASETREQDRDAFVEALVSVVCLGIAAAPGDGG